MWLLSICVAQPWPGNINSSETDRFLYFIRLGLLAGYELLLLDVKYLKF